MTRSKVSCLLRKKVGFRFGCLMSDELAKDSSCKGRILEQVIFLTDAQIVYSTRFIADQALLIDETFETNKLGMILLVIVGVATTNKNFPAAYMTANSTIEAAS